MKKIVILLTCFFALASTVFADSSVSDYVERCAKLSRPMLPSQVDEVTILWGVGSKGTTLIYSYTIDYIASDFEEGYFADAMKKVLVNNITGTDDETILNMRKLGVIFKHRYYGNDGEIIAEIDITQADYM